MVVTIIRCMCFGEIGTFRFLCLVKSLLYKKLSRTAHAAQESVAVGRGVILVARTVRGAALTMPSLNNHGMSSTSDTS